MKKLFTCLAIVCFLAGIMGLGAIAEARNTDTDYMDQLNTVLCRFDNQYRSYSWPTHTPRPTGWVKPSYTPRPTGWVKPSYTPKPTGWVRPSCTPKPTGWVRPSCTPKSIEWIKPTYTPRPTGWVKPSYTPRPTGWVWPSYTPKSTGWVRPSYAPKPSEEAPQVGSASKKLDEKTSAAIKEEVKKAKAALNDLRTNMDKAISEEIALAKQRIAKIKASTDSHKVKAERYQAVFADLNTKKTAIRAQYKKQAKLIIDNLKSKIDDLVES
ncbi:MAG: hypothetical protein ACOYWZ_00275 [Bacillota bacterium]